MTTPERGEIHSPGDGNHTPQQPNERSAAQDRNRFYRCSSGALVNIAEAAEEVCFAWANGAPLDSRLGDLTEVLRASYEEVAQ